MHHKSTSFIFKTQYDSMHGYIMWSVLCDQYFSGFYLWQLEQYGWQDSWSCYCGHKVFVLPVTCLSVKLCILKNDTLSPKVSLVFLNPIYSAPGGGVNFSPHQVLLLSVFFYLHHLRNKYSGMPLRFFFFFLKSIDTGYLLCTYW